MRSYIIAPGRYFPWPGPPNWRHQSRLPWIDPVVIPRESVEYEIHDEVSYRFARPARPHTDDMRQMLDDLGVEPAYLAFERFNALLQKRMAEAMDLSFDQLVRGNGWR